MSGIYIPGMEMPKNCWSCPFSVHQDPDTDRCLSTGTLYETTWARFNNRLPACPLVPEPDVIQVDLGVFIEGKVKTFDIPKLKEKQS